MTYTEEYIIYLRKSRADKEAEMHGEGETLARHEKTLTEYASKHNLYVSKIYKEVVSGESIAARPEVQKMIADVETGKYAGVLVMEIERLARGDTRDQGYIAAVFKDSNTKIITPLKVYDPNNEYDEEYFEFGLFMSRREYKTINRRIQRGRIASVKEGKYIASTAPYGYERVKIKDGKGWTLKIVESEAAIVRLIFDLYVNGKIQPDGTRKSMGLQLIAKELDSMGVKPRNSNIWSTASLKDMIVNPTYAGKVPWQREKTTREFIDGVAREHREKRDEYMLIDGLHEPIIDMVTFARAGKILKSRIHGTAPSNKLLKNPLTGLVYCKKCGAMMTRTFSNTRKGYYTLKCPNRYCDNVSAPIELVESKLLESLRDWLTENEFSWRTNKEVIHFSSELSLKKNLINSMKAELSALQKQLDKAYTLVEQGIYSPEVFVERSGKLQTNISVLKKSLFEAELDYKELLADQNMFEEFIPQVKHLLDVYYSLENAEQKNSMLKTVLKRAEYLKTEKNTKGKCDNANFELTIAPRIRDIF